MVIPPSSTHCSTTNGNNEHPFPLHTFLQAKPPAFNGFARRGYHGWRNDITKCHIGAKGAACRNNDGVVVLTGRERACCGSCSLAAPDGGHKILSYYVSHSGPFSPSLFFFFALVSLAHLLTPCWTSVVISRHFTAKRRQVNESSRTQRKKLKGNPDVMVVGGWVKLAYYDMLWCVYEDGLFPTL